MRILLDTHILLWALSSDPRLSNEAVKLIGDSKNEVLVSAASIWEISIKYSLGRLSHSPAEITEAAISTGFSQLPIAFEHCHALAALPAVHSDPFDRMLIAQSLTEPAILVTHDRLLKEYGSTILLV
ncbi:type II toxin-antitoxin system VapC family toxin [soil metagenome]